MFGGGKSVVIQEPKVSDGNWHNATVTVSGEYDILVLYNYDSRLWIRHYLCNHSINRLKKIPKLKRNYENPVNIYAVLLLNRLV